MGYLDERHWQDRRAMMPPEWRTRQMPDLEDLSEDEEPLGLMGRYPSHIPPEEWGQAGCAVIAKALLLCDVCASCGRMRVAATDAMG